MLTIIGSMPAAVDVFAGAIVFLHCALSLALQCIVIGHVCVHVCNRRAAFVCVCLWVCYHDNSKLHALILTKLDLWIKVVTISSWLNFGCHTPPWRGSVAGWNFLALPYYSPHAVFASLWALFSFSLVFTILLRVNVVLFEYGITFIISVVHLQ